MRRGTVRKWEKGVRRCWNLNSRPSSLPSRPPYPIPGPVSKVRTKLVYTQGGRCCFLSPFYAGLSLSCFSSVAPKGEVERDSGDSFLHSPVLLPILHICQNKVGGTLFPLLLSNTHTLAFGLAPCPRTPVAEEDRRHSSFASSLSLFLL